MTQQPLYPPSCAICVHAEHDRGDSSVGIPPGWDCQSEAHYEQQETGDDYTVIAARCPGFTARQADLCGICRRVMNLPLTDVRYARVLNHYADAVPVCSAACDALGAIIERRETLAERH